jgi:hypothetical protein
MVSILVRLMSAGLADGEWLDDDKGEVVAGDVVDRAAEAKDLMQFSAWFSAVRKSSVFQKLSFIESSSLCLAPIG